MVAITATNIGTQMLMKRVIKMKKDIEKGKVNGNNLVVKWRAEFGTPKSRVVKIKAVVDVELADAIDYILAYIKPSIGIEPSVYFGKKVLEVNRKYIIEMKNGMKEFLESEQEDEQTEVQNGAEK